MLGLFRAWELLGGVSIVEGSCSASPLLFIFSLVVFFAVAHVAVGADGVGTITSVAEQAVATLSGYATVVFAFLRAATIAPAVSIAAAGVSYSPATCGELWAVSVLTNADFSAASAMSADAEPALGGAEALGLVAVPTTMSDFSDVPLCRVCARVPFFSAGG